MHGEPAEMGHLVVELLLIQQTVHLKQKKAAMATVQIKKNELSSALQ